MTYSTTLDGAVTAAQTEVYVDDLPTAPVPPLIQIGDEVLALDWVHGNFSTPTDPTPRIRLGVRRGQLGTTAATHGDAAAVANFSAGSGGGVSVDNGTDPPTAVTTLVAPGAVIAGDSATLPLALRRLGPYRVNFDATNINSDIVVVGDALPDGATVIQIWALVPTEWVSDTGGSADIRLEIASYPTPYVSFLLKEYAAVSGTFTFVEPQVLGALHGHVVPAGTDAAGGSTENTAVPIRSSLNVADYAGWSAYAGDPVTAIQLAVEAYVNAGDHFVSGALDLYAIIAVAAS